MFGKYFHKCGGFVATALVASFFLLASGAPAFADANTLGDMFCNVVTQLNGADGELTYINLIADVAYVSGIICILLGIHHLRLHADNARNHPLQVPMFLLLGGTLLIMLPAFSAMFIHSLYGADATGGTVLCAAGVSSGSFGTSGSTTGTASSSTGLDGMVESFVGNINGPAQEMLSIIAMLVGAIMMVRGLMKASKYGSDPKTHSVNSIMANIVFGALLMTIGDNLNVMLASVFSDGTTATSMISTLSWSSTVTDGLGSASASFQAAVNAALIFVRIIGYIAFVRGWMILKKVVEGGGNVTMAQGITHIVGGVCAINIFEFLKTMDTTFGTNLLT